jgi:hypothetical protein
MHAVVLAAGAGPAGRPEHASPLFQRHVNHRLDSLPPGRRDQNVPRQQTSHGLERRARLTCRRFPADQDKSASLDQVHPASDRYPS